MGPLVWHSSFHTDHALLFYPNLIAGPGWRDLSLYTNTIINVDVSWLPDKSLHFNGTSSYLEIPHQNAFSPATFTYAFWINPDTWTNETTVSLISKKTGNNGYLLYYSADQLHIYTGNPGNQWDIGISIPTGVWTHLAYTYDTTKRFYFNGELAASSTLGNSASSAQPLRIGINSGNTSPQYYCGKFGEFVFLGRALSSQEVARLYLLGWRK